MPMVVIGPLPDAISLIPVVLYGVKVYTLYRRTKMIG